METPWSNEVWPDVQQFALCIEDLDAGILTVRYIEAAFGIGYD